MKGIYTIYDTIADEIGPLMIFNTDEQAQRSFPSAFKNNPDINIWDFKLLYLGTIETNLAMFSDIPLIEAEIPIDKTPYLVIGEFKDSMSRGKVE